MINKEIRDILCLKYNYNGSTLRRAQLRMLEMLKFIDKICTDNNLVYWLDSGTLLGAVRHGGFIPWDDDVDICMPREDMVKLKNILISNYSNEEFVIQCNETDPMYLASWIVLRDTKSEYIQDNHLHSIRKYRGLQIDIFPVEENTFATFHTLCIGYQGFIINRLLSSSCCILHYLAIIFYNILYNLVIPFFRLFKNRNITFYRMAYGCTFKSKRYFSTIYPLSKIKFEGYYFSCPSRFDLYLDNLYKNWRNLPDKIETHNAEIIFYD